MLLETPELKDVADYLNKDIEWVNDWFKSILGWNPLIIFHKREIWIKCHDIPTHAWSDAFFNKIDSMFESYLHLDEEMLSKTKLDVARLAVKTSFQSVIDEVLKV